MLKRYKKYWPIADIFSNMILWILFPLLPLVIRTSWQVAFNEVRVSYPPRTPHYCWEFILVECTFLTPVICVRFFNNHNYMYMVESVKKIFGLTVINYMSMSFILIIQYHPIRTLDWIVFSLVVWKWVLKNQKTDWLWTNNCSYNLK